MSLHVGGVTAGQITGRSHDTGLVIQKSERHRRLLTRGSIHTDGLESFEFLDSEPLFFSYVRSSEINKEDMALQINEYDHWR